MTSPLIVLHLKASTNHMSFRPSIPSVEQVEKSFREIQIDEWNKMDCTQVQDYVKKLDEFFVAQFGFIFRTLRITNSNNLPQKVYRVRKYDTSINAGLISEFSHPPASSTKTAQRANLPYHPVFYCAPSAHTALIETLKYSYTEGEANSFFLSEWCFRKDQPIYVTPFMYGKYDKVDLYNIIREKSAEEFIAKIPDITNEEVKSLNKIFEFVSSLFEYEDSHAISGYLGHSHLYASSNLRTDVFIYPSIQTGKAAMNFAIHPNAVLHKLFLNRVFLIQIVDYKLDKNKGRATFHLKIEDRLGINNQHGYMTWRNLPNEDLIDFEALFPKHELTT